MNIPRIFKIKDNPRLAKRLRAVDASGDTIHRIVAYNMDEGTLTQIHKRELEEIGRVVTSKGVKFKNIWSYDILKIPFSVVFKLR